MFRFEKDMIPVLREHLSLIYNTEHFVEEFSSGLGIADLVFTTKKVDVRDKLVDYESMYYILNYFNNINHIIIPADLISKYNLKKGKFCDVIRLLKGLNCIVEYTEGQFIVERNYKPCLYDLNSIEAKLGDWKKGFYQALRYKHYSHKCFLAISYEYAHRVDKNLLKTNNVGLISVFPTKIEILFDPIKEEPVNKTAFYYLSETFASKLGKFQFEYQVL